MNFSNLSFPEAPLIRTPPPGPKSKEYLDYQSLHESSAVSYPKGMPMAIRRAKGATVEDVDGNIYIDFFEVLLPKGILNSNFFVLNTYCIKYRLRNCLPIT